MSELPLKEQKESQLTVVEEVHDVSAANAQAPVASIIKTRGSRRPRLSLEEKQEIARLYADTSTSTSEICARLGIGESSLYRIVQLQGVPLRGRTAPSVSVGTPTQPVPAPARTRNRSSNAGRRPGLKLATSGAANGQAIASEMRQPPEPAVAPMASGARAVTGSRRTALVAHRTTVAAPIETLAANSAPAPARGRRARTAEVTRSGELLRFTVTFLAEQTFQAASALDALQQAQARGATEVASIVRIA
jgi:transposase-like protein